MYIVVEGPIGAGKTSLSRLLAERLDAELNLEVVEENPFLARFYEDPARFSFSAQVFFLLSRFKQLSRLNQGSLFAQSVVSDYLFDKDFIFASMNLRDEEFDLYRELYEQLRPRLSTPDLTVFLRAEPDLLLGRIAKRGRPFEQAMDPNYLRTLNHHYDEYFRSYRANLFVLEAADYDFVEDPTDREKVLSMVLERASVPAAPGRAASPAVA
ncbi:MAG TPA: deoxynucleoside kinase [Deinococcales bacterium]|nr:deoxynucleoside kinase [Deinococcales bacterium]